MKSKRAVIYARVSTDRQTTENQLLQLREFVARRGWTLVAEHVDEGVSGTKGVGQRPALKAMLSAASRKQFDVVVSWKMDRLGRSLRDLLNIAEDLHGRGIDLAFYDQEVDTTTAAGRLFFHMVGAFAQFERELIVERVNAGLQRAREQGKTLGRPKVPVTVERAILKAHRAGTGQLRIAKELGIGTSVVQRVVRAAKQSV